MTHMNRASTLLILGNRASGEEGLGYLHDAVAGYELALEVYQRATMASGKLGYDPNEPRQCVLETLVERASGERGLGPSTPSGCMAMNFALEVRQRATMPADWATTQMNRASCAFEP